MEKEKKAYTNDEIYEILEGHFKNFVLVGEFDNIKNNGEYSPQSTFLARNGNLSCCYGLAYQAARSIENTIDGVQWDEH